jgi:gamma-glutamyltranspeptidase / glutathione hydrolase
VPSSTSKAAGLTGSRIADHPPQPRACAVLGAVLLLGLLPGFDAHSALADAQPPLRPEPVLAAHAMVSSQEQRATRIGLNILEQGGNAVDAAVAIGFALAVTHPQAGNLGGGGFMIIRLADRKQTLSIDYRESAPARTTKDIFLDPSGQYDPRKSRDSGLAIGVPGSVAGLTLALAKYGSGRFALADVIAPALALARQGIPVEPELAAALKRAAPRLQRWSSTAQVFFRPDGVPLREGDVLVQPDLADTLSKIAQDGPRAFYDGPIAAQIAAAAAAAGGLMTAADLGAYQAIERPPLQGTYRGYGILSMPPPSSGGVHLVEMLNVLEGYDLAAWRPQAPEALHLLVETMKRAYADRAKFLGDPDHVDVPVEQLTSKAYAERLRRSIDPLHATPAAALQVLAPSPTEGANTTHFSVVDRFGNAVANTYTLNFQFGVGLVAAGTGVLLNNELDDFAAKPDTPNAFGLTGGEANAPGPGKRPLSSMTPTIVLSGDRPLLVTGSPGGSTIITTVLQLIVNVIDFHENIAEAVAAPRIHNQWLPDQVFAEPSLPPEAIHQLEARGHKVVVRGPWGSANSVLVTSGGLQGAADPRTPTATAAGN